MKSNYLIVTLALLASGFMGCSDDDGDNWKKKFENEQEKIKEFVYIVKMLILRSSRIIIVT